MTFLSRGNFKIAVLFSILMPTLFSACGGDAKPIGTLIPQESTGCPNGRAAIEVGDAYLRILCGCQGANEADGTTFSLSGGLTCTLPTGGGIVSFHYLATTLQRQVLSSGRLAFVSSPLSDPRGNPALRVHSSSFGPASGTYDFAEAFTGMTGSVIVP